jgi:hypothetical protein
MRVRRFGIPLGAAAGFRSDGLALFAVVFLDTADQSPLSRISTEIVR